MHHNNYINNRIPASKLKDRMALWSLIAGLSLFCLLSTNILLHKYLMTAHQKDGAVDSALEAIGGGIMLASQLGRRCSLEEIEFHAKSQPQKKSACPRNLMYMAYHGKKTGILNCITKLCVPQNSPLLACHKYVYLKRIIVEEIKERILPPPTSTFALARLEN
jgi:hypothetical protein